MKKAIFWIVIAALLAAILFYIIPPMLFESEPIEGLEEPSARLILPEVQTMILTALPLPSGMYIIDSFSQTEKGSRQGIRRIVLANADLEMVTEHIIDENYSTSYGGDLISFQEQIYLSGGRLLSTDEPAILQPFVYELEQQGQVVSVFNLPEELELYTPTRFVVAGDDLYLLISKENLQQTVVYLYQGNNVWQEINVLPFFSNRWVARPNGMVVFAVSENNRLNLREAALDKPFSGEPRIVEVEGQINTLQLFGNDVYLAVSKGGIQPSSTVVIWSATDKIRQIELPHQINSFIFSHNQMYVIGNTDVANEKTQIFLAKSDPELNLTEMRSFNFPHMNMASGGFTAESSFIIYGGIYGRNKENQWGWFGLVVKADEYPL